MAKGPVTAACVSQGTADHCVKICTTAIGNSWLMIDYHEINGDSYHCFR